MQFIEFKQNLEKFIVFNVNDIRKIEVDFDLRRLDEWKKKGYIKMIRRRYYMFADTSINESILSLIANTIYEPSYISLESALSRYNLIPESVYSVTSVTSQKAKNFKTEFGRFSYRQIKPSLMFGYKLVDFGGRRFRLAEIEKAVLDYLYLNPHIKDVPDFEGVRFNVDAFREGADIEKFKKYVSMYENASLGRRAENLLAYINNHD
jgi:predicted transcriptional regulator of viral defense system